MLLKSTMDAEISEGRLRNINCKPLRLATIFVMVILQDGRAHDFSAPLPYPLPYPLLNKGGQGNTKTKFRWWWWSCLWNLLTLFIISFRQLYGNPLACDCRLVWFARWTRTFSSLQEAQHVPQCAGPSSLKHQPLTEVSLAEMKCGMCTFYSKIYISVSGRFRFASLEKSVCVTWDVQSCDCY